MKRKHIQKQEVIYISYQASLKIVLNCCLGSMYFGYNLSVLNLKAGFLQTLIATYNVTLKQMFLVEIVLIVGALLSSVFASNFLRKVGRRWSLIYSDLIGIIGTVLILLDPYWCFLTGRFVQGLCIGINSVLVPIYIREMSPITISGELGVFHFLMLTLGIALAFFLGALFTQVQSLWVVLFGLPLVFNLIRIINLLLFFKHETPLYYMIVNQEEKAQNALSQIYLPDYVDCIFQEIEIQQTRNVLGELKFRNLFSAQYKQRLLTGIGLFFFQVMSGIFIVIQYSSYIFQAVQKTTDMDIPEYYSCVSGIFLLIGGCLAYHLLNQHGRKIIFIVGQSIVVISLLGFTIITGIQLNRSGSSQIMEMTSIILLNIFYLAFSASTGPVVWIYIAEILPVRGVTLCTVFFWMILLISTVFSYLLSSQSQEKKDDNLFQQFITFFVFSLIGLIFFNTQIKETKNMTNKEIERQFIDKQVLQLIDTDDQGNA